MQKIHKSYILEKDQSKGKGGGGGGGVGGLDCI
jgi:hypothetical protein